MNPTVTRDTTTAAEVLDLLEWDLGGVECLDGVDVESYLHLPVDAVRVFEGKTIHWFRDVDQDPFDFSDPWVDELAPGCWLREPVEGLAYAYIICSIPGPGGGRWACLWKGKLADPSEVD